MDDPYVGFPDVLRTQSEPRFVCFALEPDPKHPEKPRKVPRQPRNPQYGAASTNPTHWSDYWTAVRAAASTPGIVGIGYMFVRADGIVGVDLDDCLDADGDIAEWALPIVHAMCGTYGEISLNGRGLHFFARGTLPPAGRKRGNVEMYDHERYFVVTGRTWTADSAAGAGRVLLSKAAELLEIHRRYVARVGSSAQDDTLRRAATAAPVPAVARIAPTDDDQQLLDRMFASAAGARIHALYRGDCRGYDGDHSAADLALVNHLLYWADGDVARADRLFRSSALMRAKWDAVRGTTTYGQRTIATALQGVRTRPAGPVRSPLAATPRPAGWAARVLHDAAAPISARWWEPESACP